MPCRIRRLGIGLLALALITAGCQAPVADGGADGSTATPTTGADTDPATDTIAGSTGNTTAQPPDIEVRNGSLRVDPGTVFQRVQKLLGTDVPPPAQVRIFETSERFRNRTGGSDNVPAFWRLAGLETGSVDGSALEIRKNGYVTRTGEVGIYFDENATVTDERLLLAHEFTHYVQTQNDRRADVGRVTGITTTESGLIRRAIIEGGAVFTADAYMRSYDDGDELNSAWYPEIQAAYPDGHVGRLLNGRYIHGYTYVESRIEAPAALSTVYESPPQTSEQLLYGLAPGTEPATPLSVEAQSGDEWLPSGTDRYGELFVRYALESELGEQRATRAAAGWGNDTLVFYQSTEHSATGYVWVLDWDDAANDTEFRDGMTEALNERGNRTDGTWALADVNESARIVDIDSETTAVLFGPERFVEGVSFSSQDQTVTVAVDSTNSDRGNASSPTARGR